MENKAIVLSLCKCIEDMRRACAPQSFVRTLTQLLIDADNLPVGGAEAHLIHFYTDSEPEIECCIARLALTEIKECLRKAEFLISAGFDNTRTHFIITQLKSRMVNSNFEINMIPNSEEKEEI